MQLSIKIDNIYEDGDKVTETKDIDVPEPPNLDTESERHQDWAFDYLFPFTGTGRTHGDAGYFVEILASDDAALIGNEYEWGI
jgi:hypothetical protein